MPDEPHTYELRARVTITASATRQDADAHADVSRELIENTITQRCGMKIESIEMVNVSEQVSA